MYPAVAENTAPIINAIEIIQLEWKVLSIFVVFAAALLAYSGTIHEVNGKEIHSSWIISIAFIIGAVFSATAGYIGMKVATKANVRTTQAARTSLKQAHDSTTRKRYF